MGYVRLGVITWVYRLSFSGRNPLVLMNNAYRHWDVGWPSVCKLSNFAKKRSRYLIWLQKIGLHFVIHFKGCQPLKKLVFSSSCRKDTLCGSHLPLKNGLLALLNPLGCPRLLAGHWQPFLISSELESYVPYCKRRGQIWLESILDPYSETCQTSFQNFWFSHILIQDYAQKGVQACSAFCRSRLYLHPSRKGWWHDCRIQDLCRGTDRRALSARAELWPLGCACRQT